MADEHRPLRPAPVLPPPQSPGYGGTRPPPVWPPPAASGPGAPPYGGRPGGASYDGDRVPPRVPVPTYPPAGSAQQPYHPPPGWPPGQPPIGYRGWNPGPPPRRRPTGLARALLGLVMAGAALLFGLVVLGSALGEEAAGGAGAIDHSPARPAPDGGGTAGDPDDVLRGNPLYAQGGLANGDCPAEDLGDASLEEQERFYDRLLGCLDREWGPPVKAAGFGYRTPGLVVFDAPVSTPCGSASPEDGRTLAFYCPGDAVLYADVPQMRRFFGNVDVAYAILIGHEFGHHVQREVGVLAGFDDAVYDDYDQRLILSRRVELQASCMGGLFLGAVAQTFPVDATRLQQLEQVAGSFGDEDGAPDNQRDHGSGASNRAWIMRAFTDNDIAVCNTFAAPADAVD